MIDLILGQATISTTITLTLPATLDPHPVPAAGTSNTDGGGPEEQDTVLVRLPRIGVEVPRVGLLLTSDLALLLSDPDTRIRPALHDPDTGTLTDLATRIYRPNTLTARFVRTRDGTCRFPGCATPARRCHLDHVTPHAHGGPIHPSNLITLCQRHHRLKHHGGWTLTMTPTGAATWTNGIGQHYLTHPHDPRHTAA